MDKDHRKERRRPVRYTAWLALAPDQLHGCVISDISEAGARIELEDSSDIPNCFFLFLSNNGSARRVCRVVWRKPAQIGVKFERSFAEAERADAANKTSAEAASEKGADTPGEAVEPA